MPIDYALTEDDLRLAEHIRESLEHHREALNDPTRYTVVVPTASR